MAVFVVLVLAATAARAQVVGDVNCDGGVNGDDATDLLAALFDDPRPSCPAADVNADGRVESADIVALMQILPVPPTPIPEGPDITFFAATGADGTAINPLGQINGVPVFFRNSGSGFKLAVEGRAGSSGAMVGTTTIGTLPDNPSQRPDLQIESSNPLGDGSPTVCDGGVPGVSPPDFGPTQAVTNALNDLACNFATASLGAFACTQDQFGSSSFLGVGTEVQFCLQVSRTLAFVTGDTVLTARLRDVAGNLGPAQQLILRVGPGALPPTFTPAPTFTPFVPRPTRTPSLTYTPSPSQTPTPSRTSSPAPTFTRQPTLTPSATWTATIQVSPTVSPTRTLSPTRTGSFTPVTPTTPSPTGSPTRSRTPTNTATVSPTGTRTGTASRTPSQSPTPSPTVPAPPGPVVSFFGLTRSDDTLIAPSGTTVQGVPIFTRSSGSAFNLVVEGKPGPNRKAVGRSAYQRDLTFFPDLEVEVSQPLGNGSLAVCDVGGTPGPTTQPAGGVPATDPPNFQPTQANINSVNDLACRFIDGSGQPVARAFGEACTPDNDNPSGFVDASSTVQFCASVTKVLEFPDGDTLVTVRFQDTDATPGPTAQIVVRISPLPDPPTVTPTPTPTLTNTRIQTPTATISGTGVPTTSGSTPTPPPSQTPTRTPTRTPRPTPSTTPTGALNGPVVTFFGLTQADGTPLTPDTTTPSGLPVYMRPNGLAFSLVVEGKPGASGMAVGPSSYQSDLSSLPDLQVEVSQPLGNGSPAVCDSTGPTAGGVPAIDPPNFDSTPDVINAVNDLSCRFVDGVGQPVGRGPSEGCILSIGGDLGFADATSTIQFCGPIGKAMEFPPGDTTVTVRLLDMSGNPGPTAQLVIRVGA